jgi:hydroxymethylbilane synthase
MKIRIGTRKSQLALWQANYIADRLREIHGVEVEQR